MRIALALSGAGLLLLSCMGEQDHVPFEPWSPYNLFDSSTGFEILITPPVLANGDTLHVIMTALPRHAGVGICELRGQSGGHPIGDALSPVTGEIGAVSTSVPFAADDPVVVDWTMILDTPYSGFSVTGFMAFDSVVIDGLMCSTHSQAAYRVFGTDFIAGLLHTEIAYLNRVEGCR